MFLTQNVISLAGACSLSPLRGPCRALLTRWYYDVTSDTCETFSYGGCRGNANNFRSMESCWRYCRPVVDEKQHESRMRYLRVLGLLRWTPTAIVIVDHKTEGVRPTTPPVLWSVTIFVHLVGSKQFSSFAGLSDSGLNFVETLYLQ